MHERRSTWLIPRLPRAVGGAVGVTSAESELQSQGSRLPRALATLIIRHPLRIVVATTTLAILALVVTVTQLEFQTGRGDLVSSGERNRQLDERYEREFEELPERVVVVIRPRHPEAGKAFAAALGRRWEQDARIEKVLYRVDPEALKGKALFYLSPDELAALERRLATHRDLLRDLADAPTLASLFALINRQITTALVDHLFTRDLLGDEVDTPLDVTPLQALVRRMHERVSGSGPFQSPWHAFFATGTDARPRDGFLRSDDGRLLFVLANPKASAGDFNRFQAAVGKIRADVIELKAGHPDVEVGITGRAVLESDEMAAAQRDMTIATVISVVGVAVLFAVFFKGVLHPALAAVTLLVGASWALGFATLTIGHLNILTIAFMPMLVGLSVDYSIHFIARYEEERAARRALGPALARTFSGTGWGIAAAALTTAVSFLALLLAGFKGLAELGFVGGSGVLLAALATFTMLPALLVLADRRGSQRAVPAPQPLREPRGDHWSAILRRPAATLILSVLLVALAVPALGRVRFDFNLLHLQAEDTEAARWARTVFESERRSVLFEEVAASSLDEARRKVAALRALPSVAEVESILSVLPEDQERKRPLIMSVRDLVADLSFEPRPAEPVDLQALRSTLERIRFKMGDDGAPAADADGLDRERHEVRRLIDEFLATAGRMDAAELRHALAGFQAELFGDLQEKLEVLKADPRAEPVTPADLPAALRARYVGRTGHYRLFVFPAEDVWEFAPLTRFVADVRSVDAEAHGTPGRTYEYLRMMKEGYERAGFYALVGVALLTVLTFRAVGPALLALIPLTLGAAWTLGLMGLAGVPFNVANLLLLPLLVGIGIDNGIYVIRRFGEADGPGERPALPRSTARAITLSGLTTMVGFGSLMISSHRGIQSLGLVVVLGVGSVLVASLATLPSLLALVTAGQARRSRAGHLDTAESGRGPRSVLPTSQSDPAERRAATFTRADGKAASS